MRLLHSLALLAILTGSMPAVLLAQTTTTDLEVTGIEFSPISGIPTNVIVRNTGSTTFSGQIRSSVTFLNGSGQPLYESQGALDYGRASYPDAFINGAVPQRTILAGETHRISMTEIPKHRHRGAIKAKAEIRVSDASAANNTKTITAPMPDLTSKFKSITKDATSDRDRYDRYTLKYDIVNSGAVGFVAAASMSEPRHHIVLNYQSGKSDTFGYDFSYGLFESIPTGGSVPKERSIYVNKQETPVNISFYVDMDNRLAESDEYNNIQIQNFTPASSTPTPSPTSATSPTPTQLSLPTAIPSPIVVTEVSAISAVTIKTVASSGGATLLGITVKPCTALAAVKDTKDTIVTALTFNTSKKVENKLKQAATRANAAQTSTDPACVTKQLAGLQSSQAAASTLITKLSSTEPKKAEPLALYAIQASVSQIKAITYQAATTTPTSAVKTQITANEKAVVSQVIETAKIVADASALKSTVKTMFEPTDSAQSAVVNLKLVKKLAPIEVVAETIEQVKKDNIAVVQSIIDSKDETKTKALKEFISKVDAISDQKIDKESKPIELEDFVKSVAKDEPADTTTPSPTSPPSSAPSATATPSVDKKKAESTNGENITPKPDANITPNTNNEGFSGNDSNSDPCPKKEIPDNVC